MVVFVAGLLFVATTSVRSIRNETAPSNCQTQLRTLKLATEQYRSNNQAYPVDETVLVDTGLVTAEEIDDWTVRFGSSVEPVYQAVEGGACEGTLG